ncbi:patatin-like phospholipase family protein [Propionivibrio sp.]|uniref:patatin-like phospholipase family protein n=1 Tax=Propionivibrio sp. TaxID=2212460 RepID=UPI00260E8DF1|nr:patatin-like phospholipase family protein [Propionivibrio sp.]
MNDSVSSSKSNGRTALVLAGGGARAAYQVGVLLAIRDLLPEDSPNPFSILCGTSAGAINAIVLACGSDSYGTAVESLSDVWRNFHAGQVYRSDPLGIAISSVRWLGALVFGWLFKKAPRSLLDNTPLRELLEKTLDFSKLGRSIDNGSLYAVCLTASGYTSGQSVSYFQARSDVQSWERTHRFGSSTQLSMDHLLASSAIPFIFPAVRLNREYFGDGSMRQLSPISPAIHLGAEKILIIGSGRMSDKVERQHSSVYPTLAQIAGHVLSSIFLDSLAVDIERMQRINRTLEAIPDEVKKQGKIPLRPIQSLVISPSERLDYLAARHVNALPWAVRWLLRGVGAMNRRGGALASYLLFESSYTRVLIDLGYKDTMARRDEVVVFLGV